MHLSPHGIHFTYFGDRLVLCWPWSDWDCALLEDQNDGTYRSYYVQWDVFDYLQRKQQEKRR